MRQGKRLRQYPDHLIRFPIDGDGFPERAWVAAVAPRPHSITQNRRCRTIRFILFRKKEPPRGCGCAEHGKKIRRNSNSADTSRFTFSRQIVVCAGSNGDFLETVMPVFDVEVLSRGKPVLRN